MEAAYGAGRAGAPFDPVAFIKKPQVIVRLLSLVCIDYMIMFCSSLKAVTEKYRAIYRSISILIWIFIIISISFSMWSFVSFIFVVVCIVVLTLS